MTAPIQLTPADIDPLAALKASKPQVSDDPLAQLLAQNRANNPLHHVPTAQADASSALPYDPSRPGDLQAIGQGLAANGANIATSLPGTMAVASGIRALARGQSYNDARRDLQAAKDAIPAPVRIAENVVGSGPLALVPGSPAQVGAATGALGALLDADPNRGLASRALGAVVGTAAGYAGGKLGEVGGTIGRMGKTPLREDQLIARQGDQAANAAPLYKQANTEGQGLTNTDPYIGRVMNMPTLQSVGKEIRANDDLMSIPSGNSPEFLDKVFKGLSDDETSLQGRLDNLEKGDKSANGIRQQLDNVRGLKKLMLDAMGGQNGGPMPTYPSAVNQFATDQAGINAVKRGYETLKNSAAPARGGVNQLEFTPAGAEEWAANPNTSPAERDAFAQGAFAKAKEAPFATAGRVPIPIIPGKAVRALPSLLRRVGDPGQEVRDMVGRSLAGAAASPFAQYDPIPAMSNFMLNTAVPNQ